MNRIQKHYYRARNPKGFWGLRVIKNMNGKRHAALPQWVFESIKPSSDAKVLDMGCGGGANVARLLDMCPDGRVTGLDFSALAIEIATDLNYRAIKDGQCVIAGGNAMQMPLAREVFDMVTAFEAIYYWASLDNGLAEAFRVLRPGGTIIVANELDGISKESMEVTKAVDILRVYTSDEIESSMAEVGFKGIKSLHDEQRHYVCVTARKP